MTIYDPSKKWSHPMPVWVSRKDADGFISNFAVPMWLFLTLGVIWLLNAVLWGLVGLYEVVHLIVGLI